MVGATGAALGLPPDGGMTTNGASVMGALVVVMMVGVVPELGRGAVVVGADTGVGACDGALMTGDRVVSSTAGAGVEGKPPCATGKLVGSATDWWGLSGLKRGGLTGPSPGDITGAEGESIALVNCIRCYLMVKEEEYNVQ